MPLFPLLCLKSCPHARSSCGRHLIVLWEQLGRLQTVSQANSQRNTSSTRELLKTKASTLVSFWICRAQMQFLENSSLEWQQTEFGFNSEAYLGVLNSAWHRTPSCSVFTSEACWEGVAHTLHYACWTCKTALDCWWFACLPKRSQSSGSGCRRTQQQRYRNINFTSATATTQPPTMKLFLAGLRFCSLATNRTTSCPQQRCVALFTLFTFGPHSLKNTSLNPVAIRWENVAWRKVTWLQPAKRAIPALLNQRWR